MNPYLKLFAAVGLVAGGFFVARLMGDPEVRSKSPNSVIGRLAQIVAPTAPQTTPPPAPGPLTANARLVPDAEAPPLVKSAPVELPATIAPPLFSNDQLPHAQPISNEPPSLARANTPLAAPPGPTNQQPPLGMPPRARLRDEAPRPLEFERLPDEVATSSIKSEPRRLPATSFGSQLDGHPLAPPPLAQGFTPPAMPGAAINASYEASSVPQAAPLLAPPSWPGDEDQAPEARSHIVSDGDSLARLAARYLGDERRGREIYELNRGVLTDPDLLPIGVQLAIPPRRGVNTIEPKSADTFADRTAPRAQLLRPLPIEPVTEGR